MKTKTIFLKLMLIAATLFVAFFSSMFLYKGYRDILKDISGTPPETIIIAIGLPIAVVAFYLAVWFAWQLLRRIDKGQAFSYLAVKNLKQLKWSCAGITFGLVGILPQMYQVAQNEDAPVVLLIFMAVVALPLMVTIFLAVLEKLWSEALDFKQENDLTV